MAELKELRGRILNFFMVQPNREPVGLDLLAAEFDADDLKKLVPADVAEAAVKEGEKAKKTLPETKAERTAWGRQAVMEAELQALIVSGEIKRAHMAEGGLGYKYEGEAPADVPAGQKTKLRKIPLDQIRVDPKVQQREKGLNEATVEEYALSVDSLPPVRVFISKEDGEEKVILSRGFHRLAAHRKAGRDVITAEVFEGDRDAAILDAVGDNATHGLRRTPADMARAVRTLLTNRLTKHLSKAQIAKAANMAWGTADKLIKKIERELEAERREKNEPEEEAPKTRKGADGKTYKATKAKPKPSAKEAPSVTAPKAPEEVPSSGVKDRTGAEVSPDVAPVFMDTRFPDAIRSMRELVKFLNETRADYALSSMSADQRKELFKEIEFKLETLAASLPFAAVPEGAQVETGIARRKMMNEAEYKAWVKGGKKMKKEPAPAPSPAPVATEPAPVPEQAPAILPMNGAQTNGAGSPVPEKSA